MSYWRRKTLLYTFFIQGLLCFSKLFIVGHSYLMKAKCAVKKYRTAKIIRERYKEIPRVTAPQTLSSTSPALKSSESLSTWKMPHATQTVSVRLQACLRDRGIGEPSSHTVLLSSSSSVPFVHWVRRNRKGKQVEIQPECPFSSLFKAEPVLELWSSSPSYGEEDTSALRVPKSASGCRAS